MDFEYEVCYTSDLGTYKFSCRDRVDAIAFAETLKEYSEDEDALVVVVIRRNGENV